MGEARRFPNGCVASPHYLASSAGLSVLASGGNALDAAIATNLVLGVVTPYLCGYGGDLFALVWDGELHAYNGSGRSPAGATVDAVRDAAGADAMPGLGPLTVTVPGAVRGWFDLLDAYGTRGFDELAGAALALARDGFPLTERGAGFIRASAQVFTEPWAAAWRDVYADASAGSFAQPDMARTIEALAANGPDPYYRGPIAEAIAASLADHGSAMTPDDLASHTGDWVDPLIASYRGHDVVQMPPNSQGVVALEALRIAEGLDLGSPESVARHHMLLEATKLALADREYVTDLDHMSTPPEELFSDPYVEQRRALIDGAEAGSPAPGHPATGGTIYLCAADADGMVVSLIQSNFLGFGSGVTVPGWGINLQNRGAYFSLDPTHANVIAPRKRTMHTLMPAMVLRDGEPVIVFGTMGGDGQAQTHVQVLTRMIDDGLDVQQAIDAPRWVVAPNDWTLRAESRFDDELIAGLTTRGHAIRSVGDFDTQMGHAHGITVHPFGYAAASDPRSEGAALGH